jgi:hypothetical protein
MKQFFENQPAVRDVKDQTDGSFEDGEETRNGNEDGEIEEYRKEAQKFIDSRKRLFATFAKDISLSFKVAGGFFIDLEKGEVNLDAKWFSEKDFSQTQIFWACLHELGHFCDLNADPEGMMKNFEYIRKQARKTGAKILKKWEEKYGESDPEFVENLKKQKPINPRKPEKGTMNAAESSAYKIHHTFYNIFDDINDNSNIAGKAPAFEKETEGGREIARLYQEKLFAQKDYSKLPRHLQFLYKLIREEMVSDEETILSDEVFETMGRKIMFQGREYPPQEIVENFIKPKKNRDTLAGQRYFILQKTLEPIFEELLMKDLDEWDPKKPEKQDGQKQKGEDGGESGNPFEENYEDYDRSNPDQFSEEEIGDWMDKNQKEKERKKAEESEKENWENMTAEEKVLEAQDSLDRNWCEKNSIDFSVFKKFKRIEAEVEPYLRELSRLWQRIIFGSSREIKRETRGHFKTGTEMDIQKVIEEWPKIKEKKFDEARVMKRTVSKEVLVEKPELIRVRLVGDMSGSMDEKKIHVLQQCFALIFSSLREFNTHLNRTRSQTKSKLKADTEGWIFGDNEWKMKKLRGESDFQDEQVEIIKMFENLNKTIGNTYDNKALEAINNSIPAEDAKKIKQGKIMDIVFEITDGGSSDPTATGKAVDKLSDSGVIARAFQIGETSQEEKRIFNEVWNDSRTETKGEIIGEEIANLIPAIAAAFKKHLSKVKL